METKSKIIETLRTTIVVALNPIETIKARKALNLAITGKTKLRLAKTGELAEESLSPEQAKQIQKTYNELYNYRKVNVELDLLDNGKLTNLREIL